MDSDCLNASPLTSLFVTRVLLPWIGVGENGAEWNLRTSSQKSLSKWWRSWSPLPNRCIAVDNYAPFVEDSYVVFQFITSGGHSLR